MEFIVNFSTNDSAPLDPYAWQTVTAANHQEAAIEALKSCIQFYLPFGAIWARVHGETDAKNDDGSPALIHAFLLQFGMTNR